MKKSEHIWRAVQDKNISYKEKQNLADILRHRNKLDKLKRKLRGNKARKWTSVILRRISGSGVFPRHPDTIVRITPDKVDEAFAVEMMLRTVSTRSWPSTSSWSQRKQSEGDIYKKE